MVDEQVKSLMQQLEPTELPPPQHRHLLLSENFIKLGASSTANKQLWIADVATALEEAPLWNHLRKLHTKPKLKVIKIRRHWKIFEVSSINSPLFPHKQRAKQQW